MRHLAVPMILLMLTASLAGCTGGDPDGGGDSGTIDSDALNEIIQQNLQDFINNTTITVNQEIHYHNNTTSVSNDNSVNNVNGTGLGSGPMMNVFTIEWNPHEHFVPLEYGSRIISISNGNLQQSTGNNNLLFATVYNGFIIEFEDISCEVAKNFAYLNDGDWRNFLLNNYGEDYNDLYDVSRGLEEYWSDYRQSYYISNYVNETGISVNEQCGYTSTPYVTHNLFSIDTDIGEAIEFLTLPYNIEITASCESGFTVSTANNSLSGSYIGGHEKCTIFGKARIYGSHFYNETYHDSSSENSSYNTADIPEDISSWWERNIWYQYEENTELISSSVTSSFAVYYKIWNVNPISD